MARRRRSTSRSSVTPALSADFRTQQGINAFNETLRADPGYREYLASIGVDVNRSLGLSDSQRKQANQYLASRGYTLPGGLEIDPAGNVNQNEGFGKQLKRWGPIAGAGALAAFGLPGVFPGLLTGSAAPAVTAAGTLPSYGPSAAIQAANLSMGPIGSSVGSGVGAMAVPGVLKTIGKGALSFLGGGKDGGGFGIDDLIKLLVAGGSIKDLFGIGNDEEAEWATFENESRGGRSLDPRDLLAQGLGQSETALADAQARAKTPVRLRSSFAQQPPVFTGGGLPMPIGVTGVDPAMKDPNLLKADMGDTSDEDALAALEML